MFSSEIWYLLCQSCGLLQGHVVTLWSILRSLSQSFSTRCITIPTGLSLGDPATKEQFVTQSLHPGLKICSKYHKNLRHAHVCPRG